MAFVDRRKQMGRIARGSSKAALLATILLSIMANSVLVSLVEAAPTSPSRKPPPKAKSSPPPKRVRKQRPPPYFPDRPISVHDPECQPCVLLSGIVAAAGTNSTRPVTISPELCRDVADRVAKNFTTFLSGSGSMSYEFVNNANCSAATTQIRVCGYFTIKTSVWSAVTFAESNGNAFTQRWLSLLTAATPSAGASSSPVSCGGQPRGTPITWTARISDLVFGDSGPKECLRGRANATSTCP